MLAKRDIEFLRRLSILAGLRDDVIASIGEYATRLDIEKDQLIFREGEPSKSMAVVLEGTLDIVKRAHNGAEMCIATLGPGEVVGEMSLIDIQPCSADVWARAPASVVILKHSDLANLYRGDAPSYTLLVLNIAREISIRLRRLDSILANVMGQIQAATSTALAPRGTGTQRSSLVSVTDGVPESVPKSMKESVPESMPESMKESAKEA